MLRILSVLLFLFTGINSATAVALKKATELAQENVLVPHRAVYKISLASRREGVSVRGVDGRMVFEITGSPCEGYTQNTRTVTRITNEQGKETVMDLRSSTWEKGNGQRFRFTSTHYFNHKMEEMVSGSGGRDKANKSLTIKLTRPGNTVLKLDGKVLFPTQHSLQLLKSAQEGRHRLSAEVYDGSEQGQGFYQTHAYIGDKVPPEKVIKGRQSKLGMQIKKLGLSNLASWPIAISYFDKVVTKGDNVPTYELSFRLYPNGVSRKLWINYGDFAVHGELDKITYLRKGACN